MAKLGDAQFFEPLHAQKHTVQLMIAPSSLSAVTVLHGRFHLPVLAPTFNASSVMMRDAMACM